MLRRSLSAWRSVGRRSLAPLGLVVALTVLVGVPGAGAEQAASNVKRIPSGFVEAGAAHSCVILSNGSVRCWGFGGNGRLGYGNTNTIGDNELPSSVGPVDLGAGRRATAIAAGGSHTCVILDTGAVRCWGNGGNGRLGYGNTTTVGDNETPGSVGTVDLGGRAVAITAGDVHTCAIIHTGDVRCWGFGGNGRLGYGNANAVGDNETPASVGPVSLGRKAVAISAGLSHTCAILDDGSVRCWGSGATGRLGYGNADTIGDNEVPSSVGPVNLGGKRAIAISAGDQHTCVILGDGTVKCWGVGLNGRLGYGNTNAVGDNEAPAAVGFVDLGAGRRAVGITAGGAHTCVLLDNGSIRCFGSGGSGRLGSANANDVGDNETPGGLSPVDLGAGLKAVAVSAGSAHTCVLAGRGTVRCWGFGANGRLGYGNTNNIGDNETPAAVGAVDIGGLVAVKARPTLALGLKPQRDRRAPFNVRASGKLRGFPADTATCKGRVVVRAKKGKRTVVRKPLLKLGAGGCTYGVTFRVPAKGVWKVTAQFPGNGSLIARAAAPRKFSAG